MLPKSGVPASEVLDALRSLRSLDADWRAGRLWNLVFYVDDEVGALARAAAGEFQNENGVSPLAFPSIRRLQGDLIAFTGALLQAPSPVAGVVTSGGSESILLATLSAREHARARGNPSGPLEILMPVTAHPAWEKAAFYLGLTPVRFPVGADLRADVGAARRAVTDRTALVVGSAPTYCHGVVDPIEELGALARDHAICMHVDACLGGFLLPFARSLGRSIPPFDLAVEGVTSISADLHKYGFAPKGVGVLLYRDPALRDLQFFVQTDWAGGIYATPTAGGSRSVSPMAAAWAIARHLGQEGYERIVSQLMLASDRLIAGIRAIDGLEIQGEPVMTVFAISSSRYDIHEIADRMHASGWILDRQQAPASLHVTLTQLQHASMVDDLLRDLEQATRESTVRERPAPDGPGGTVAEAPGPGHPDLRRVILGFLGATLSASGGTPEE